jgi:Ca2+-binding RTX toxin-like protein
MRTARVLAPFGLVLLGFGAALFGPVGRQSASAIVAYCSGFEATITGAGVINGTNGPDVIVGSNGNDVIRGNGGNDIICGGLGDDTINGGSGNDYIFGDDLGCFGPGGNDTMRGDGGNDWIEDNCGINDADGGTGNDTLVGTGTMNGGAGSDVVSALGDYYNICGGCFTGLARGGAGDDYFVLVFLGIADGGSGDDSVNTGAAGDQARGGSGDDYVSDYFGFPVTLNGGSGNDTCVSDNGDDTFISCEVKQTY